jgi:hypothetical protein
MSRSEGTVLLGAGEPRRAEFRVFATGTSDEPRIDLNRVDLRSTIKVEWTGPKEAGSDEGELQVESRGFVAWLETTGAAGERRTEILFHSGKDTLDRHLVSWEVVSPITATPKMIVMKEGQRDCRVSIESGDRKLFRVTRIKCESPGISARALDSVAADKQSISVQTFPSPAKARGVVTVFVDHPAQQRVDIPFVVLE